MRKAARLTDSLIYDWLTNRLTEGMNDWLTDKPTVRLTDKLSVWVEERVSE